MASATLVARKCPDALFLDVGSTTTDVIPIVAGRVAARGRRIPARLRTGELVYTGALRTPVCAIVRSVPLRGRRCRVAAEHFAVAADVHLWRDGSRRATTAARRRTAGAGVGRKPVPGWPGWSAPTGDARPGRHHGDRGARGAAQVRQIAGGLRQVMRRLGPACPRVAVLAGQGTFLARAAAAEVGLATRDLAEARIGHGAGRARSRGGVPAGGDGRSVICPPPACQARSDRQGGIPAWRYKRPVEGD